jgi:hypothetical protein
MKAWFGPLTGTNAGYSGVWRSYDVMPVSWQGWLATLIYFAVQVVAAIVALNVSAALQVAAGWVFFQALFLHLVFLWVASRHFVSQAETDPLVLPVDLRKK